MDQGLLSRLMGGGGWDALKEGGAAASAKEGYEVELQRYELAQTFAATFRSGPGAVVLDHLRQMTIEQPAFYLGSADIGGGEIASLPADQQGFIREGQNSLVRYIEDRIRAADAGPPAPPVEPQQEETQDRE